MSEAWVEMSLRQLDLVSGVESWHAKERTITAADVLLSGFLATTVHCQVPPSPAALLYNSGNNCF